MSILARVVVFLASLAAAAAVAVAQAGAPVPIAEPQATSVLRGTLSDVTGAAVPRATVTVVDTDSGRSITGTSNGTGDYQIPVPSGSYTVKVTAAGFSEITREVTVGLNAAKKIDFTLGGPIPIVNNPPQPPVASATPSSAITIQTCTATTRDDLIDWLRTSADGHRLLGVVSSEIGKGYFIWIRDPSAHPGDIHISDAIAMPSRAATAEADRKKSSTFAGSYRLTNGYLLFYR